MALPEAKETGTPSRLEYSSLSFRELERREVGMDWNGNSNVSQEKRTVSALEPLGPVDHDFRNLAHLPPGQDWNFSPRMPDSVKDTVNALEPLGPLTADLRVFDCDSLSWDISTKPEKQEKIEAMEPLGPLETPRNYEPMSPDRDWKRCAAPSLNARIEAMEPIGPLDTNFRQLEPMSPGKDDWSVSRALPQIRHEAQEPLNLKEEFRTLESYEAHMNWHLSSKASAPTPQTAMEPLALKEEFRSLASLPAHLDWKATGRAPAPEAPEAMEPMEHKEEFRSLESLPPGVDWNVYGKTKPAPPPEAMEPLEHKEEFRRLESLPPGVDWNVYGKTKPAPPPEAMEPLEHKEEFRSLESLPPGVDWNVYGKTKPAPPPEAMEPLEHKEEFRRLESLPPGQEWNLSAKPKQAAPQQALEPLGYKEEFRALASLPAHMDWKATGRAPTPEVFEAMEPLEHKEEFRHLESLPAGVDWSSSSKSAPIRHEAMEPLGYKEEFRALASLPAHMDWKATGRAPAPEVFEAMEPLEHKEEFRHLESLPPGIDWVATPRSAPIRHEAMEPLEHKEEFRHLDNLPPGQDWSASSKVVRKDVSEPMEPLGLKEEFRALEQPAGQDWKYAPKVAEPRVEAALEPLGPLDPHYRPLEALPTHLEWKVALKSDKVYHVEPVRMEPLGPIMREFRVYDVPSRSWSISTKPSSEKIEAVEPLGPVAEDFRPLESLPPEQDFRVPSKTRRVDSSYNLTPLGPVVSSFRDLDANTSISVGKPAPKHDPALLDLEPPEVPYEKHQFRDLATDKQWAIASKSSPQKHAESLGLTPRQDVSSHVFRDVTPDKAWSAGTRVQHKPAISMHVRSPPSHASPEGVSGGSHIKIRSERPMSAKKSPGSGVKKNTSPLGRPSPRTPSSSAATPPSVSVKSTSPAKAKPTGKKKDSSPKRTANTNQAHTGQLSSSKKRSIADDEAEHVTSTHVAVSMKKSATESAEKEAKVGQTTATLTASSKQLSPDGPSKQNSDRPSLHDLAREVEATPVTHVAMDVDVASPEQEPESATRRSLSPDDLPSLPPMPETVETAVPQPVVSSQAVADHPSLVEGEGNQAKASSTRVETRGPSDQPSAEGSNPVDAVTEQVVARSSGVRFNLEPTKPNAPFQHTGSTTSVTSAKFGEPADSDFEVLVPNAASPLAKSGGGGHDQQDVISSRCGLCMVAFDAVDVEPPRSSAFVVQEDQKDGTAAADDAVNVDELEFDEDTAKDQVVSREALYHDEEDEEGMLPPAKMEPSNLNDFALTVEDVPSEGASKANTEKASEPAVAVASSVGGSITEVAPSLPSTAPTAKDVPEEISPSVVTETTQSEAPAAQPSQSLNPFGAPARTAAKRNPFAATPSQEAIFSKVTTNPFQSAPAGSSQPASLPQAPSETAEPKPFVRDANEDLTSKVANGSEPKGLQESSTTIPAIAAKEPKSEEPTMAAVNPPAAIPDHETQLEASVPSLPPSEKAEDKKKRSRKIFNNLFSSQLSSSAPVGEAAAPPAPAPQATNVPPPPLATISNAVPPSATSAPTSMPVVIKSNAQSTTSPSAPTDTAASATDSNGAADKPKILFSSMRAQPKASVDQQKAVDVVAAAMSAFNTNQPAAPAPEAKPTQPIAKDVKTDVMASTKANKDAKVEAKEAKPAEPEVKKKKGFWSRLVGKKKGDAKQAEDDGDEEDVDDPLKYQTKL